MHAESIKEGAEMKTSTSMKPILKWQYDSLVQELLLLQQHIEDPTCPCESESEMCARKHLLTIEALAKETSTIETETSMRDKLLELAEWAREERKEEEKKLCGKEAKPFDAARIREWRKQFEAKSLPCQVSPSKAHLKSPPDLEAHMEMPAPFGWVGGKRQLSKQIVTLIPPHKTYVEPFAGAASVFWAKEPSEIEVLNDIDPDLMHFYQNTGEMKKCNVPKLAPNWDKIKTKEGKLSPCEFFTLTECSYGNKREHKLIPTSKGSPVRSCFETNFPKIHRNLPQYQARLQNTKLHNEDWQKIVEQYDGVDTLFYFDPPYHKTSRGYRFGEDQLARLAKVLPNLKGKWILSYDDDPEVRSLFAHFSILPVESKYTIKKDSNVIPGKQLLISNFKPNAKATMHSQQKPTNQLR